MGPSCPWGAGTPRCLSRATEVSPPPLLVLGLVVSVACWVARSKNLLGEAKLVGLARAFRAPGPRFYLTQVRTPRCSTGDKEVPSVLVCSAGKQRTGS